MTTGQWVLVVAVIVAVSFGLWRAATDGRFRGTHRVRAASDPLVPAPQDGAVPTPDDLPADSLAVALREAVTEPLGERATLLQFSSAFCAPCRATRRVLEQIAEVVPGVVHVEIDAESHLELVRRLDILRTPTTVVLDAAGREVTRATGAPTKPQVLSALALVE